MSEATDDLYKQLILDHNKHPRNFGVLAGETHAAEGYNPLCGDRLKIHLAVDGKGLITGISFEGDGCAISRASASMMTQSLKGKGVEEADALCRGFLSMLKKDVGATEPQALEQLGKLKIFSGIWRYPARVKCASLAWHAYRSALSNQSMVSTEGPA